MTRQLLFSVTAADCDWSYTKGSGNGGQKKNKTSSAVHCKHRASGARGYAEDSRSQHENKQLAFVRMLETEQYKKWHRLEVMRKTGQLAAIEDEVNRQMKKIKVEVRENGKWVEVDKNATLSTDDTESTQKVQTQTT